QRQKISREDTEYGSRIGARLRLACPGHAVPSPVYGRGEGPIAARSPLILSRTRRSRAVSKDGREAGPCRHPSTRPSARLRMRVEKDVGLPISHQYHLEKYRCPI